jgi:dTMP kinase
MPDGREHEVEDPSEVVEALRAARQYDPRARGLRARLFGSPEFFRLWLAQAVSSLGDWLGFLAIVTLAAQVGGATPGTSVGLVLAARIIPGFFLSAAAGVLIDRMDRKQVMVVTMGIRAAVVAALPFVDSLLGLIFASLVLEFATLFFAPAKEALVPNVVPREKLTTANSLSLAAAYGTFPLGAGLFAVLAKVAEWLGSIDLLSALKTEQFAVAFYVNVVCYVAAAILIYRLAVTQTHIATAPASVDANGVGNGRDGWSARGIFAAFRGGRDGRRDEPAINLNLGQVFTEIKEGWHYVVLNPVVRSVNVGLATGLIGGGMLIPLGQQFSVEVLGAGTSGFGVFVFALGLGVAAGVIAVSTLQARLPKVRTFLAAVWGAGIALLIGASMSTLGLAAAFVAILGICAGGVYVIGFTLLHENVDDEVRGRIFSALYTLVRLCILVSMAIGPIIADVLDGISRGLFDRHIDVGFEIAVPGVRLTLWLAGVIMLVAGFLAGLSLRSASPSETAPSEAPPGERPPSETPQNERRRGEPPDVDAPA